MKHRLLLQVALATAAKPVIGGQAVIEGVMMRSPKSFAVAVRTPDGSIVVREEAWLSFAERFPILKLPILRGANMLVESMVNGLQALNFSAATAMPDEAAAKAANDDGTGAPKKAGGAALWMTLAVSMGFAFLLFKGVPHLSAWGLGQLLGSGGQSALPLESPLFHLVDGAVKLSIFIAYLGLLSRTNDVKRLFMYHGAEHKSVHVYEASEPLDVAHAAPKTTAHPRCGTSLMLLVIATSMFVFAAVMPFVPRISDNDLVQSLFALLLKIPLLLPIAGIAYEAQRLAARHPNNLIVRAFIAPGMLMQKLTTREPGPGELEVALAALKKALWREAQDGKVARGQATVEVLANFAAVEAAFAPGMAQAAPALSRVA